jgi:hypothetical protein
MTDDRRETTAWERQQADNELVAHARREAAERHRLSSGLPAARLRPGRRRRRTSLAR